MTYALPQDVEPEGLGCVRVYYPDNPGFLRALLSAVSYLGNWYAWERDDEKRGKDAAASWRVAYNQTVEDLLAGKTCGGESTPPEIVTIIEQVCGGAIIMEDDMGGQVVTDVTYEDGQLYVWFGPCCKQAVAGFSVEQWTNTGTTKVRGQEVTGGVSEVGGELPAGAEADIACQKAGWLVVNLLQMAELVAMAVNNVTYTLKPFGPLYEAYPWISFDIVDLSVAVAVAGVSELLPFFESGISSTEARRMACRLASAFDDEWSLSSAEADLLYKIVREEAPAGADVFLGRIMAAVGNGDWNKLATMAAAWPTVFDCTCPGVVTPDYWVNVLTYDFSIYSPNTLTIHDVPLTGTPVTGPMIGFHIEGTSSAGGNGEGKLEDVADFLIASYTGAAPNMNASVNEQGASYLTLYYPNRTADRVIDNSDPYILQAGSMRVKISGNNVTVNGQGTIYQVFDAAVVPPPA